MPLSFTGRRRRRRRWRRRRRRRSRRRSRRRGRGRRHFVLGSEVKRATREHLKHD
jgi:hypothetical protein